MNQSLLQQSSDDEPREEKDHFVAQLYKFMEECGAPINSAPTVGSKDLDLYKLYKVLGIVCYANLKLVTAMLCYKRLEEEKIQMT